MGQKEKFSRPDFSRVLKVVREFRRMGQGEVAEAAKVSRWHLAEIEQGRAHPSDGLVTALCKALKVDKSLVEAMAMAAANGSAVSVSAEKCREIGRMFVALAEDRDARCA